MTVQELIEELQKVPNKEEIVLVNHGSIFLSSIKSIRETEVSDYVSPKKEI